MSRTERFLRRWLPLKEIGWAEIQEKFTRYQLIKSPWFNLYLHQLDAPNSQPRCHDHPWWFVTLLLKNGYDEDLEARGRFRRRPGTVLFRPAEFAHNVTTPYGTSWSLVLTGPKSREWGFNGCPL